MHARRQGHTHTNRGYTHFQEACTTEHVVNGVKLHTAGSKLLQAMKSCPVEQHCSSCRDNKLHIKEHD